MDAHAAAEVEEWEPVSFSGGYEGLHELADSEFSGAVESGSATLYMVNGRVVAVDGGTIEEFETGGTARGAPHHSLPLLYAMQARDGRTRASYYTEDTPIPTVDQTLKEGGFTGYVELAENVLSGDYYVVYHGGRSTGVAFVGQSRRVVTGQDAYDRACDEVGIYEVVSVDLDVIEIPGEPPDESGEGDAAAGGAAGGGGAAAVAEDTGEDASADGEPEPAIEDVDDAAGAPDGAADAGEGGVADTSGVPGEQTEGPPAGDAESTGASEATDDGGSEAGGGPAGAAVGLDESDVRPVPSVDPDRSARAETPTAGGTADETGEPATDEGPAEGSADRETTADGTTVEETTGEEAGDEEPTDERSTGEEAAQEDAAEPGAEPEGSSPELRQELAATRKERDELAARVERLEARIEELSGGGTAGAAGSEPSAGPALSTAEALSGTNLFVRYHSKAQPTLDGAHAGEAAPADVQENLRIEHHTQFEDEGATVDGRPFEAWLADRPERAFLEWLVKEVLFEIRATGSVEAMRKLYGAIPEIDRVELDATINVEDVIGDGSRDVAFDLVARGPRGDPLIVADIESSREPTGGDALASLVTDATDLVAVTDSLAGAFFVTASYFEPDALATAEDATGGSLLSRDRRASFVKHSRKRGYHLCLVERREGNFHLKQPDL